jgi:enamine deaminase RidA (YjgF/YER057c/UK114 family)
MNTTTVNPWSWQDHMGFSQGVLVTHPHRTLYAAGQGPLDADGALLHDGDVAAQARQAMDNVETVLTAAGMTLSDVVRYDVYAVDLPGYFAGGGHAEVAGRLAAAGVVPAGGIATQVAGLAVPGMLLEVTVTACA